MWEDSGLSPKARLRCPHIAWLRLWGWRAGRSLPAIEIQWVCHKSVQMARRVSSSAPCPRGWNRPHAQLERGDRAVYTLKSAKNTDVEKTFGNSSSARYICIAQASSIDMLANDSRVG